MKNRWLRWFVCVLVVAGMALSAGCSNAFSAERTRRREYVVDTDLDGIVDDLDWALGLDGPSMIYDHSTTPYRSGRLAH